MKTLLTACLLCLLVTGAEAGEPGTACIVVRGDDLSNSVCVDGDIKDYNPKTHKHDIPHVFRQTCLAKMEAAMRTAEPYLDAVAMRPKDPGTEWWERYHTTMKQWDMVKKECWREP